MSDEVREFEKFQEEVFLKCEDYKPGYESALYNPLLSENIPEELQETPHLHYIEQMMLPVNFSFFCKEVLNISLLPCQALFLAEFWDRKFPIYVASRGFGKSYTLALYCVLRAVFMPGRKIVITGAAFRQSKVIFEYIEGIWNNAPRLRNMFSGVRNGPRRDVDMCRFYFGDSTITALPIGDGCCLANSIITTNRGFDVIQNGADVVYGNNKFRNSNAFLDNGVKPTKRIITQKGYVFEGTYNHKLKVLRDNKIQWCRTDEMKVGDTILIDRSERWHQGNFSCTTDQSYALGAMIGDGCWTSKYRLRFATKDVEILDRVQLGIGKFHTCSDKVHYNLDSKDKVKNWLNFWGLKKKCYTKDKELPLGILQASQECMTACLHGLFDTDGHVFSSGAKGGQTISINFTNTSKRLVEQIQYILLHYGIVCTVRSRDRNDKWNTVYELGIYGKNVKIFAEKIGFGLKRKQDHLLSTISKKKTFRSNTDLLPLDKELLIKTLEGYKYNPKLCRSKILQRKNITHELVQKIAEYTNNDTLRNLSSSNIYYDTIINIEDSEGHTYDIEIPDGNEYCVGGFFSHNSKIRGQRANDIIADEFASISQDIFENVIAGFAAVASNPIENVKRGAALRLAKKRGMKIPTNSKDDKHKGNQIVISGTAYYDFNHFAEYWKRWKQFIESKGDPKKLSQFFPENEGVPEDFNWQDYSIVRMPYELIPPDFMDAGQVARSRATIHSGIYQMEFGAVFSTDSNGFFKRSLIEQCTVSHHNEISFPSTGNEPVLFEATLRGNPNRKYVFGIDPASEVDHFSIVILELWADHCRIVYCWTTMKSEFKEKVKAGFTKETNFYSYCARKIRDLMKVFPCEAIALDSQGGGYAVMEALHDEDKLQEGELPLWETIDPDKPKDTDTNSGLHIIDLINFASAEWTMESNNGLRKDFEDVVLLFPFFDSITLGLIDTQQKIKDKDGKQKVVPLFDNLEDCVLDIEELKDELSTIIMTQTPAGRDKWDTPEIKLPGGKKGRLRKDRYSALLMANWAARTRKRAPEPFLLEDAGGFAQAYKDNDLNGPLYGPGSEWYAGSSNSWGIV